MDLHYLMFKVMLLTLRGISLILGGMSMVALLVSFREPGFGALAIVTMIGAAMIVLWLPAEQQSMGGRRR